MSQGEAENRAEYDAAKGQRGQHHHRAILHADAREPDYVYCDLCEELTAQYPVFWYRIRHAFPPPAPRRADGSPLESIVAEVAVRWCVRHRGRAPERYPAPPPLEALP